MSRRMTDAKLTHIAAVDRPAQKGALAVILKRADDLPDDSAYLAVSKRQWSADERKEAEEKGWAMPGGRYPIENKSDLEAAIHAVGRGKGDHAAIRAHIKTRARSLGATDMIPEGWGVTKNDLSLIRNGLRAGGLDMPFAITAKFAERIAKDMIVIEAEKPALFDDVHGGDEAGEYADGMMQEFNECYSDLCTSVGSIMCDADDADKAKLLQTTFQQFKDAIQGVVPEEFEKAISRALTPAEGTVSMKAIAKQLGLPETATEAEITAALVKQAADLATAQGLAKMSAKHTAFMSNDKAKMPKGGKDAFASMSADERDAHMDSNPIQKDEDDDMEKMIQKGDAFRTPTGAILTKKDFGSEAGFVFAKGQAADNANLTAAVAKAADDRLLGEFTKRAEPLTYIGKADEIGQLLFSVSKSDTTGKLAPAIELVLKAANDKVAKGGLFTEFGKGTDTGTGGSAQALLKAKAAEIKKGDTTGRMTDAVAYQKAADADPELWQRVRAEEKQAA